MAYIETWAKVDTTVNNLLVKSLCVVFVLIGIFIHHMIWYPRQGAIITNGPLIHVMQYYPIQYNCECFTYPYLHNIVLNKLQLFTSTCGWQS